MLIFIEVDWYLFYMTDSERNTSTASQKMLTITKCVSVENKIEDLIDRANSVGLTDEEEEVLELCINDVRKFRERKEKEWDVAYHTEDVKHEEKSIETEE